MEKLTRQQKLKDKYLAEGRCIYCGEEALLDKSVCVLCRSTTLRRILNSKKLLTILTTKSKILFMENDPRITIEIDDPQQKAQFKAKVAAESTDMKSKILGWVTDYLAGKLA